MGWVEVVLLAWLGVLVVFCVALWVMGGRRQRWQARQVDEETAARNARPLTAVRRLPTRSGRVGGADTPRRRGAHR